jgi:hypothetical protein
MTPPAVDQRDPENARTLLRQMTQVVATVKDLADKVSELAEKVGHIAGAQSAAMTVGQMAASAFSVIVICTGIMWRGVDKAEAASDRAVKESRAEADRRISKAETELQDARRQLLDHAIKDAEAKAKTVKR